VQYELRQQVVEPKRQAFQYLIERFGDRPASRYEEGTVDVQPTENFHYRPMWAPDHELYDHDFSVLKLTDPYSFMDPRQLYYAPYVASRAGTTEAFNQTLGYLNERNLLDRLPAAWRAAIVSLVLPLRHYESGAELLSCDGARFAYGTSVEQCCAYAAFDRIGHAQQLSVLGIALGDGSDVELANAKRAWLEDDALQGLRRYVEELLAQRDWGVSLIGLELVDGLLYPLLHRHLDEIALLQGAGAWSLLAQHFAKWYETEQQRWLKALVKAWAGDPQQGEANVAALATIVAEWQPKAEAAVATFAEAIDASISGAGCAAFVAGHGGAVTTTLADAGITVGK
jgi:phenol/toluene 2-monooxygenase (NADH) P1/A1